MTLPAFVNEESFNAYVKYLALRKHFTDDKYDYFKYNGKVRASIDKFRTRNDAYFFAKLAKRDDYEQLMLANFLVKPESWIRDILGQEGETVYTEWKKKIDSLSRVFRTDLNKLTNDYAETYEDTFLVKETHPPIMTAYLQRNISIETFTIMSFIANVFDYWEKNLVDKIIAPDIIRMSRKYRPFLDIDIKRFKNIVREHYQ